MSTLDPSIYNLLSYLRKLLTTDEDERDKRSICAFLEKTEFNTMEDVYAAHGKTHIYKISKENDLVYSFFLELINGEVRILIDHQSNNKDTRGVYVIQPADGSLITVGEAYEMPVKTGELNTDKDDLNLGKCDGLTWLKNYMHNPKISISIYGTHVEIYIHADWYLYFEY